MSRKQVKEFHLNREWCKGCGICAAFCPKQVLEMDQEEKAAPLRLEDCIACCLCELRCPDLAIDIVIEEGEPHAK